MNFRRLTVIALDLGATAGALLLSFMLRWGWDDFWAQQQRILLATLMVLPIAAASYAAFGLANSPWKYFSTADLRRIGLAVCIPALSLAAVDYLTQNLLRVPRTVPAIYWIVQVFALSGMRLLYRSYRARRQEQRAFKGVHRMPVLIAGTDDEAEQLIRRIQRDAVRPMEVIGLLSSKRRQSGERMLGLPVLGGFAELAEVHQSLGARGIRPRRLIITRESLRHGTGVDELLGTARRLGIAAVRSSDTMAEVARQGDQVKLSPVSIDDLLGREPRDLDLRPIRDLVQDRNVAVTGAGGSIGSELCRQITAMAPARLMLFELSELALYTVTKELRLLSPDIEVVQHLGSVCDRTDVLRAFERFRPDLVFHAAALKHVDLVEAHPVAAANTNTIGTGHVAEAAAAVEALCAVFISTDKAVNPVSILGATKRAGELIWGASDRRARKAGQRTRFLTVRFGNVLGSSGSVIPLFTEQLAHGGPITVTDPEVERYFMTISEAVRLVLMASAMGVGAPDAAPTYVLDMGEPVRILEPDVDIEISFTGLRPGERLSEELEHEHETLRATAIPGVRATEGIARSIEDLEGGLADLAKAIPAQDEARVAQALRDMVAEHGSVREAGPPPAPAFNSEAIERPGIRAPRAPLRVS
jgi:FlaA1/EpsC-like NDP-sugar epimerase